MGSSRAMVVAGIAVTLHALFGCGSSSRQPTRSSRSARNAAMSDAGLHDDAPTIAAHMDGGQRIRTDAGPRGPDASSGPHDAGSTREHDAQSALACPGQGRVAEHVQLDIHIMLDRSGSMAEKTAAGTTKWDAIRAALASFVRAPEASGLGVGLQYFPLGTPGIADSCLVDADCGASGGTCTSRACLPPAQSTNFAFTTCLTDADCPIASRGCVPFGTCSRDATLACFTVGPNGCGTQGDCVAFRGECTQWASCVEGDYENPAVAIAPLPGNAQVLVDSLMATTAKGLTPTSAALSGAIVLADKQAQTYPDHRAIVAIITDGLPTACLPASVQTQTDAIHVVAQIAMQGLAMQSGIETHVIGIFTSSDTDPTANLDSIADAGGTQRASIIDPSADVTAQLVAALSKIQRDVTACEYRLPELGQGQHVNLDDVNLQLVRGSGSDSWVKVRDPSACELVDLGWYYDADRFPGHTPARIELCPKGCDLTRSSTDARLEIRLGCPTVRAP